MAIIQQVLAKKARILTPPALWETTSPTLWEYTTCMVTCGSGRLPKKARAVCSVATVGATSGPSARRRTGAGSTQTTATTTSASGFLQFLLGDNFWLCGIGAEGDRRGACVGGGAVAKPHFVSTGTPAETRTSKIFCRSVLVFRSFNVAPYSVVQGSSVLMIGVAPLGRNEEPRTTGVKGHAPSIGISHTVFSKHCLFYG